MAGANLVILLGNLTRDVELKYSPQNTSIATSGIAVNRTWANKATGGKQEDVLFIEIVAFAALADIMSQYLRKGSKIYIQGWLKFDQWTAHDGTKRNKIKVVVTFMQMLDSKPQNQEYGQYQPSSDDPNIPF